MLVYVVKRKRLNKTIVHSPYVLNITKQRKRFSCKYKFIIIHVYVH